MIWQHPDIPDYYALLGVCSQATSAEIARAYRTLGKRYHADLYSLQPQVVLKAEIVMTQLDEAYAILSDAGLRKRYDRLLREAAFRDGQLIPVNASNEEDGAIAATLAGFLFSAFPGQSLLTALEQRLTTKQPPRNPKQLMGALSKAMLFPVPFCAAIVISSFFWHLSQVTGHPLLAGVTAVLSYPGLLIPMLIRLFLPIRYRPLLSTGQKLLSIPLIFLVALLLSWLWVIGMDHGGSSSSPFDLYWWCALISAVCLCLAYF